MQRGKACLLLPVVSRRFLADLYSSLIRNLLAWSGKVINLQIAQLVDTQGICCHTKRYVTAISHYKCLEVSMKLLPEGFVVSPVMYLPRARPGRTAQLLRLERSLHLHDDEVDAQLLQHLICAYSRRRQDLGPGFSGGASGSAMPASCVPSSGIAPPPLSG